MFQQTFQMLLSVNILLYNANFYGIITIGIYIKGYIYYFSNHVYFVVRKQK